MCCALRAAFFRSLRWRPELLRSPRFACACSLRLRARDQHASLRSRTGRSVDNDDDDDDDDDDNDDDTGAVMRGLWVLVALVAVQQVGCSHDEQPISQRLPEVEWLPLRGPLGASRVEVVVLLDGRPTPGILDTGAMQTSVSQELAQRLRLTELATATDDRLNVMDAHGKVSGGWRTELESLTLGRVWVDKVPVTVLPMGRELVLIGYDVLRRFDMVLVSDAGVVGLMPAGTAPLEGRSVPVRLDEQGRALLVDASAAGRNEVAHAVLVVDTGADTTVFPSMPAMLAAVPVDLRFTSVTRAVHGEKTEPGRYALRPLRLGGVDVGNLLAFEGTGDGGTLGLLGNAVLRQFRTTIVSADAPGGAAVVARRRAALFAGARVRQAGAAAHRRRRHAVLRVRLKSLDEQGRTNLQQALAWNDGGMEAILEEARRAAPPRALRDDACLEITIRRGAAKKRLQFVVGDDDGVLHGAVLSVIANIDDSGSGTSTACLSLPDSTRLLGSQGDASLHLVRSAKTTRSTPRCARKAICHWYTGP